MMETEWLENLKIGDEVVVRGRNDWLTRVVRLTRTQITTGSGSRFHKRDGRVISAWSTAKLVQPTPAIRDEIRRGKLASKMGRIEWSLFPLDVLVAIDNLLPKAEKTDGGGE